MKGTADGARLSSLFLLVRKLGLSPAGDSLRARFQRGVGWNVTGAILNNGANFLTNIAIANLLGREVFGEYGMIQSTLTTFVGIAQAAGGITATKYVAEFRSTNKERAGRVLGLCAATTAATGALATLLILLSAPWLASTTLKASFIAKPVQIASAVVFFTVVNAYQMGALAGLESYREWALANGLQGPIQLAICSLLAWRWGLRGAVTGLLATSAMRWLILHIALKKGAKRQGIFLRYSGLWQERAILLRFALPAALSSLSAAPAIWLGNTFLVRQTGGYSQLALFSAALNLKNVVMFLPLLLNNVGMSLLNNQKGEDNERRYRKVFWTNLFLTGSAGVAGAAIVGVFGGQLLRMYGKTFPEGQLVLSLLLFAAVVEALGMASFQVVYSQEKMWHSFLVIMLPRDIALVLFAYVFVPAYGAFGLGLAHLAAWLICSTIIFCFVFGIGLSPRTTQVQLQGASLVGAFEGDGEL
jgi:O-antigen/teichoic acid export membrane protein